MRKTITVSLFVLATLTWALAQNPGSQQGQTSSQRPDAAQTDGSTSGSASQDAPASAQDQSPTANAPITEGCLGGSDPNYTITDNAGTTYKLSFPANADVSILSKHLGESVQVMGDVNSAGKAGKSSIDVTKIGKGTGTCPGGASAAPQAQPHK